MTAGQIVEDIPCERCGYDLRGLKGEGQCPECGFLIHLSTESWRARQSRVDIAASDPRWIANVNEGFALALLTFALMMLLSFGVLYRDGWMFEWKSAQRRWTLGVACTMFVFSWAAAWKISVREKRSTSRPQRVRTALRIAATAYMLLPFIMYFAPRYNAGAGWIVIALIGMLAGWIATVM